MTDRKNIKYEKALNKSVMATSELLQQTLGIYGVQHEKSLYRLSGAAFMRLYKISLSNADDLGRLYETLCANLAQRFRLTGFVCKKAGIPTPFFFLSVYFYGNQYSDIYDELSVCDESLVLVSRFSRAEFSLMSTEMYMSCLKAALAGDPQDIDDEALSGKRYTFSKEIIKEITPKAMYEHKGFFKNESVYGLSFMAMHYPDKIIDNRLLMPEFYDRYYFAIETQKFADEDRELYKKVLGVMYNTEVDNISDRFSSIAYKICFVFDKDVFEKDEKKKFVPSWHKERSEVITSIYEKCGYTLTPCFGHEYENFYDLCNLGATMYTRMRVGNPDTLKNLL